MFTQELSQELLVKVKRIEKFIGNTPLFPIKKLLQKPKVEIYAKLEWHQLGSSVKARPAFNIIKEAILAGELHEDKILIDASSGNTGIAYGAVGAALGIPVTLCLPENASKERKMNLKALGVNIIYTSPLELTDGAQRQAKALYEALPYKYFYADQYANENNWRAHYLTTANEIYQQTQGLITHFITGLGTTGTFMGTSRRLKELNPAIEVIEVHPNSPMHGLEGWKHMETALVPKIYHPELADQSRKTDTFKAYHLIKQAAQKEGLLLSPSSAANLSAALELAESIDEGVIVTVFPDSADKYGEVIQKLFN
ncbi:MAG: cysteine synthase family protein [Microscillaceae bacterium]|nr:cysteine synthase family protein [Microscillaceae bacterium]